MFKEPTNADRAEWAEIAVGAYADARGSNGVALDVKDLTGDLLHLLARDEPSLSASATLDMALATFKEEVAEEAADADEEG